VRPRCPSDDGGTDADESCRVFSVAAVDEVRAHGGDRAHMLRPRWARRCGDRCRRCNGRRAEKTASPGRVTTGSQVQCPPLTSRHSRILRLYLRARRLRQARLIEGVLIEDGDVLERFEDRVPAPGGHRLTAAGCGYRGERDSGELREFGVRHPPLHERLPKPLAVKGARPDPAHGHRPGA